MMRSLVVLLLLSLISANTSNHHLSILNDLFSGTFFASQSPLSDLDDYQYQSSSQIDSPQKNPGIFNSLSHFMKILSKPESFKRSQAEKFRKFSSEAKVEDFDKAFRILEENREMDMLQEKINEKRQAGLG